MENPAIVCAAFGASSPEARNVYAFIEEHLHERYPRHEIFWAWTSNGVRKSMCRQGLDAPNVEEIFQQIKDRGYGEAVVQSFHVTRGHEYQKIISSDTYGIHTTYGAPVMAHEEDVCHLVECLCSEVKPNIPNVFVGHGSESHDEPGIRMNDFAVKMANQHVNTYLATVEGTPGDDAIELAKEQAVHSGGVHFIPLMLVSGVHIADDVMGAEPRSWRNRIGVPHTTCAKPLGYHEKVLSLLFDHLDVAYQTLRGERT